MRLPCTILIAVDPAIGTATRGEPVEDLVRVSRHRRLAGGHPNPFASACVCAARRVRLSVGMPTFVGRCECRVAALQPEGVLHSRQNCVGLPDDDHVTERSPDILITSVAFASARFPISCEFGSSRNARRNLGLGADLGTGTGGLKLQLNSAFGRAELGQRPPPSSTGCF